MMAETARATKTEAERALTHAAPRAPHEPQWLTEARDAALRAFEAHGLPNRKVEAFHFTDLKALIRQPFPPITADEWHNTRTDINGLSEKLQTLVLPLVNGEWNSVRIRVPTWVELDHLRAALERDLEIARLAFVESSTRSSAISEINLAQARDGVILRVEAGKHYALAIHHTAALTERGSVHVRHLIVLEEGASADVLEIFESEGAASLTTSGTVVHLAAGARLNHTKLVKGGASAINLGVTDARLGTGADYRLYVQGAGASLAREEVNAKLDDEGGHFSLGGMLLLSGERHFDITARIDHAAPRCTSNMTARAVLAGHSKGVVQGAVRVAPHAQHTEANQQIRGLLLSDRAEFDSKPELEILADDVKCAHGAASGDLDHEAIFYLRSRGLPEDEARGLLIEAFLEQALAEVENETLRDYLRDEMRVQLKSMAGGQNAR